MRLQIQEQFPSGMEICVVLVGSLSHDNNKCVLMELKDRYPGVDAISGHLHIHWITLRASTDPASTMAGCILTLPSMAQPTRDIFAQTLTLNSSHLVTRNYEPLLLPDRTHPNYNAAVSHAITKQVSFLASITLVSFGGFADLNPFTTVPPLTLMANSDPTKENSDSMAFLILYGQIPYTGIVISSPVTNVATDFAGTWLFLYSPKQSADALIKFADLIYELLPMWTQQQKPISKDF
jgi:hypothetical protein